MEGLTIKTIPFKKEEIDKIKTDYNDFNDYPIIYILHKEKEAYIGETVNAFNRLHRHRLNRHNTSNAKNRHDFKHVTLIKHEKFNQSATYNLETKLINYFLGDERYTLRNVSQTVSPVVHNYYQKKFYAEKVFDEIWRELLYKEKIVNKDLFLIDNNDIFKLSPFKELTPEQFELYQNVEVELEEQFFKINTQNKPEHKVILIEGSAGVGKSVILSSLYYKTLALSKDKNSNLYNTSNYMLINHNEALKTFHKLASSIKIIQKNKILKPTTFINQKTLSKDKEIADIVFIDEAHLLFSGPYRYKYYNGNNQLEDIINKAKVTIIIFDPKQVTKYKAFWNNKTLNSVISKYTPTRHTLFTQMRIHAGDELISWIDNFIYKKIMPLPTVPNTYDFDIFDCAYEMHQKIKNINSKKKLSRVVSTVDFDHKKDGGKYYVNTGKLNLLWNQTDPSTIWANREDSTHCKSSIDEVGSIYTVQGFDLNYVGVILGPSISYDEKNNRLLILSDKYKDIEAFKGLGTNPNAIKIKKEIILNSLNILLKRGIKGLYIYAHDEKLRTKLLELKKATL
ncbi:DUF2075 domain-containing protein (plasmid) [Bacillus cereus]|uniref:DUF2075 domain-containing protein n=1 Tax=Bacillus cereus TaxID=1396 RepID=UPI0015612F3C|nr:DUF2075 domain-containing protein [Bacillus cereus]QKH04781.1 DUF2075 domain-containing protein [Bacillus cereus]QKH10543.1 DUF2075 domain-containing protein [Bacillus cereus]